MDSKWQEKFKRDEAEFACYVKGKYFAQKEFLEAIAGFFEVETTRVNVNKANSETGTIAYADAVGNSNAKDVVLHNEKVVSRETAKETTTTTNLPNGKCSSKRKMA